MVEASASSIPATKSRGVVAVLAARMRPLVSSNTATSVNVPPISTPIRCHRQSPGVTLLRGRLAALAVHRSGSGLYAPDHQARHWRTCLHAKLGGNDFRLQATRHEQPFHVRS